MFFTRSNNNCANEKREMRLEAFLVLQSEGELAANEQDTPRILHPQQEQRQGGEATIDGAI